MLAVVYSESFVAFIWHFTEDALNSYQVIYSVWACSRDFKLILDCFFVCVCVCVWGGCLSQRNVFVQTLGMVCVLCVSWVYFSMIVPTGSTQLLQLGLACSVFTITMYLSPLADLVWKHLHCFFDFSTYLNSEDIKLWDEACGIVHWLKSALKKKSKRSFKVLQNILDDSFGILLACSWDASRSSHMLCTSWQIFFSIVWIKMIYRRNKLKYIILVFH